MDARRTQLRRDFLRARSVGAPDPRALKKAQEVAAEAFESRLERLRDAARSRLWSGDASEDEAERLEALLNADTPQEALAAVGAIDPRLPQLLAQSAVDSMGPETRRVIRHAHAADETRGHASRYIQDTIQRFDPTLANDPEAVARISRRTADAGGTPSAFLSALTEEVGAAHVADLASRGVIDLDELSASDDDLPAESPELPAEVVSTMSTDQLRELIDAPARTTTPMAYVSDDVLKRLVDGPDAADDGEEEDPRTMSLDQLRARMDAQ